MTKSNAKAQSDQLFLLQVQGDKYARLLVEQKQRHRQLEAQWQRAHEELKELRLKRSEGDQRGGGANAVRAKMADEQRELMKLENRLSACRTRESKMIALNNDLKHRVDALRAMRVLSQQVFEKNQRKLREIQRQMQECFRMSTQIMAERDRIIAQAYSLTAMNMDEQESFDSVYQTLAAIIKRERDNAESYRKQVLEQDPLDLADDFIRGNMKLEEEQLLRKTLQNLDLTMMEDKQTIEMISDKVKEFESTFAILQQQMGVSDYHDLVKVYTKKEEENFALFRYVQSLNNEIEQLEEEKQTIETETHKLHDELKDGSAHARKRLIDDLVETRQKILKENAEYERLRASAAREFQPIARSVDRLYNALGCNDIMPPGPGGGNGDSSGKRNRKQSDDQIVMMARINSMNDLLAAHGITEGNILQFLAIIEQRSSELIEQFSRRLQHKNPMETSRATLGAHLKPSDPMRAATVVRSLLPEFTSNNNNNANNGNGGAQQVGGNNSGAGAASSGVFGSTVFSMGLGAHSNLSGTTISEEDVLPNTSDDEDSDRPMTKAEMQKRAAKTYASLQLSPGKMQPQRAKPQVAKKKK
ncbi:TPA: hypothetical protein N0F65_008490 [Lagenidium giganteum]|uniref:ODAD1 central coiled coil region domain-containing protein n=1 Tax=Lagenidium giganteum TaxID=4803 RepID=A0AAV2Z2D1_9STRA|nr:TPA: hypothetical protein N0F65_008490 [Lagenidium giganteum]